MPRLDFIVSSAGALWSASSARLSYTASTIPRLFSVPVPALTATLKFVSAAHLGEPMGGSALTAEADEEEFRLLCQSSNVGQPEESLRTREGPAEGCGISRLRRGWSGST